MSNAGEDGWQALAEAIILQAVEDYRLAQYRNRMHPHQPKTEQEIRGIEQFFCSEWFNVLCTLDGSRLLRDLKKQIALEEAE